MNYDEFAFFNRQLATMLRDGIPLEGALKQLCVGLKSDPLRRELTQLENDLARGVPLTEAMAQRDLPPIYRRLVQVGIRSNNLPGVLLVLADYYERAASLWNRLKGLMVYPLIVIVVSLLLTTALSIVFSHFLTQFAQQFGIPVAFSFAMMWVPPVLLALLCALACAAVCIPKWRASMRWRLPAFREASLAQFASMMALMLRSGVPLPEALALTETAESDSPAGTALAEWLGLIQRGEGKPTQWPQSFKPFPPMFLWLVQKGGEDLAGGFEKAAEIYRGRASYRIEMALYGALPVSILILGQMVVWQAAPLFRSLIWLMNSIGGE